MKTFQEHWEEILTYFDFDKCEKAMSCLNWTWSGLGQPTKQDIIRLSRKLALKAYEKNMGFATGGLKASYSKEQDSLELEFILENWFTESYE